MGFSAAVVVLWTLWAAALNTAQFGDNVEQFNWAQSLEAGYYKHPPLPSWMLGAVVKLLGPSIYWAYALATLCLLGTIALTWMIGREWLGERVAAAAVVIIGLSLTFSQRAQLYNHNTVLILCIAATVWLALRASCEESGRPLWWVATGLSAAAALLSKYQAAMPLAGLILALVGAGRLKRPAQWSGLLLAFAVMLLVCAPHAVWVAQHDFSTLRYASGAIESAGLLERIGFMVSFVANQIRIWFPALLAIGLCWAFARRVAQTPRPGSAPDTAASPDELRAWFLGLVWSGLLALAVMALVGGVSLRNHWGVQALQFFCLWLAYQWERLRTINLRHLVWAALLVHGLSLAWYAIEHRDPAHVLSGRRIDTMYPATRLARAAVAHWYATTPCPLHYVAGTAFEAGLVSLYSGHDLKVFESEQTTPWIRPEDLRRRGALYVLDDHAADPAGVTHIIAFDLVRGDGHAPAARIIKLGVLAPRPPCQ